MAGTDFQSLHEIVAKAKQNLNANVWDYIYGGAETETTVRRNRLALDSIAFRPRVLRDMRKIDLTRSYFGRKCRLPIMLAPVGSLEIIGEGGAATTAQAASEFGVPLVLSSVSQPGLEATAKASGEGVRLFQLYVRGDHAFVEDHVRRAMDNGYSAFCFTVDTAHYSRRERDLDKRYVRSSRANVTGRDFQEGLAWPTIQAIRKKFKIPLMLKGIATAEDAKLCVKHGIEWIWVSNHGGRQLDHGRGSMDVLPEILDAAKGKAKVIIDGAFNRGTDIIKGIAMGADAVAIGRMHCYGLAADGKAGVLRVLDLLEDEMRRDMGLLGCNSLDGLDRSYLHAAQPTNDAHVLSAFPLLKLPT
jgi:isopentenyl diphosphate isomerase/L-lactate dehydrogenase-like FMN-dependent dehydrogenase